MKNIIITIFCILLITVAIISKAPKSFPASEFNFYIERGDSVSKISTNLLEKKMIQSEFLFKILVAIFSLKKGILAGDYKFIEKENIFSIAYRMTTGDQRQKKIHITISEGTNVVDMASIFQKNLQDFNVQHFISLAKKYEGYMYPDTYDFLSNTKPEEIVRVMRKNFDDKIKILKIDIEKFNKPLKDIVIMASIVEKEANTDTDRKLIAGVLWKRINVGMLLQTDPVFYYITGKTGNITYEDLKVDSPYNVYKYKGLPIGPISNPSIETIKDVINPTQSKYFFYLTGKDGTMKYAETYDKHIMNKNMYLN